MIENLEITNGTLNKKFNNEIYDYEVSVDENVSTLTFNLDKSDDTLVTYYGNDNLTCGEGHVYLESLYDNKVTTYTFLVNKECTKNVVAYTSYEEDSNFFLKSNIRLPLISGICIILIIIVFFLVFKKK